MPLRLTMPFGCCRSRVEADNQLFGMLMRAAGASGDLDLVLGLREEMLREGLRPCTVRGRGGRALWASLAARAPDGFVRGLVWMRAARTRMGGSSPERAAGGAAGRLPCPASASPHHPAHRSLSPSPLSHPGSTLC
jgi:pentatricopeptide repeat protein